MKKILSLLLCFMLFASVFNSAALNLNTNGSEKNLINNGRQIFKTSPYDLKRVHAIQNSTVDSAKQFVPRRYAAADASSDGSSDYGYKQLNPTEQQVYSLMKQAAEAKSVFTISNPVSLNIASYKLNTDEVDKVYTYFRNDNPQFFWLDWYYFRSAPDKNNIISHFALLSLYDIGKIDYMQLEIKKSADVYLNAVKNITDPFQKELALHDMMDNNICYNSDDPYLNDAHNLFGVFVSKTAVCEAYAKAFQYLLNLCGVQCIYVTGSSQDVGHAWDIVCVNNKYYQVDPTWDDPDSGSYIKALDRPLLSHMYFNITTEQLENDHTIDTAPYLYNLPDCTANNDNYFVKEGYYYTGTDNLKSNLISSIVSQINSGDYLIEIKTDSSTTLQDIMSSVFNMNSLTSDYSDLFSQVNQKLDSGKTFSTDDFYSNDDYTNNMLTIFLSREDNYKDSHNYDEITYKTELEQEIIYAQDYLKNQQYYSSDSYSVFSSALQTANSVNLNINATQDDIDSAAVNLLNAINGLQLADPSAPVITLSSYNKALTNQSITIKASTNKGTLNAVSHTFTQNGSFAFVALDSSGDGSVKTVTITNIDKTPPEIISSADNGGYVWFNVRVFCSDDNLSSVTATFNGTAIQWPTDNEFKQEGYYEITAADKAGNISKYSFTIDKTAPLVTASVGNGKATRSNVSVTYSDANLSVAEATCNGKSISWPSNNLFTAEGDYVVTVSDKAGNSSVYTFIIDKSSPVISTSIGSSVYTAGNVSVTCTDKNLSSKIVMRNAIPITWPSDNTFSADGNYIVMATDKAGNSSKCSFTIDRTAPIITAKKPDGTVVKSGSSSSGSVKLSVSDTALSVKSVTMNGNIYAWPSDNTFYAQGAYVITAKDKCGNSSTYSFSIK